MRLKHFSFIVFSMALTACSVNQTATVTLNEEGYEQVIEYRSGELADDLSISDIKVGSAGDLMKAQVTIKSGSRFDLAFEYKFKWLDKDGFEIALDSRPWTPVSISPYESKSVQAVAPNASAKAFKVLVQN